MLLQKGKKQNGANYELGGETASAQPNTAATGAHVRNEAGSGRSTAEGPRGAGLDAQEGPKSGRTR